MVQYLLVGLQKSQMDGIVSWQVNENYYTLRVSGKPLDCIRSYLDATGQEHGIPLRLQTL